MKAKGSVKKKQEFMETLSVFEKLSIVEFGIPKTVETEDITNLKSFRYILLNSVLDDIIKQPNGIRPEDFKLVAENCMLMF